MTETAAGTAPRRILLVEDYDDIRRLFEAAPRGELVVRVCDGCGAVLHVPVAYCHTCGSGKGTWMPVAGTESRCRGRGPNQIQRLPIRCRTRSCSSSSTTGPGCDSSGISLGAPALTHGQPMRVRFEDVRRCGASAMGSELSSPVGTARVHATPTSTIRHRVLDRLLDFRRAVGAPT